MVDLFGNVRDEWIEADLSGWLAPNRIYPGVADAVRAAMTTHEVYIVTTKQAHYTEILMRDMAGVDFPADRIFSQTVSGRPKGEVLAQLAAKHGDASTCIFVEDKLSTLEKVGGACVYVYVYVLSCIRYVCACQALVHIMCMSVCVSRTLSA